MDIILAQDYLQLGFTGDIIKVKRGYARNFLIPRGLAVEASSRNKSELKHRLDGILAVKKKLKAEAEKRIDELKNLDVSVTIKLGSSGKSFGSVGTKDIEQALKAKGLEISRKQIILADIIKSAGEFPVSIKLHADVTGEIMLKVVPDKAMSTSAKDESGQPKKSRGKKAKSEASNEDSTKESDNSDSTAGSDS